MAEREPTAELGAFSSPGAVSPVWARARGDLQDAQVYWLSSVRPDGRPHVTPLLGVWLDGALYFCTGPTERKARNLAQNPCCVLTTGRNTLENRKNTAPVGLSSVPTDIGPPGIVCMS